MRAALGFLMLSSALTAQPVQLKPGLARRFSILPQSHPSVLTGITVAVPGGASRLTIDVQTDVLSNDVSLWACFGRDVVVAFGTVTTADFSSQTIWAEAGDERI